MKVTSSRRPAPDAALIESALATLLSDDRSGVRSDRRSGPWRAIVLLVCLIVVPASVAMVPTGNWLREPGPTPDVRTWIHARGAHLVSRSGELLTATVYVEPEHVRDRVRQVLDRNIEVVRPRYRDVPAQRRWERIQRARMTDSATAAIAAASELLGRRSSGGIHVSAEGVIGPSAGLMIAIGIVDVVGGRDLTRGRVVAGTGTISPGGRVGEVGGVPLKVVAAERAHATLFLVPDTQAPEARSVARQLHVVGVSDLAQAIRTLAAD